MTRSMLRAASLAFFLLPAASCRTPSPRPPAPPPPPTAECKAVIRIARSYLPEEDKGRPAPKDCSDFVDRVFREKGIRLPRTSEEMSRLGRPVRSSRELRMGDLLFFAGSRGGHRVGHVAIYVNNGIFIHQANPGEGVRMESLYSDYYRKRYLKARRVLD